MSTGVAGSDGVVAAAIPCGESVGEARAAGLGGSGSGRVVASGGGGVAVETSPKEGGNRGGGGGGRAKSGAASREYCRKRRPFACAGGLSSDALERRTSGAAWLLASVATSAVAAGTVDRVATPEAAEGKGLAASA